MAASALAGAANAQQLRGVALHPMDQDKSATTIQTEFQMLQSAGATSVRFDVYWSEIEANGPGQYNGNLLYWMDWVMGQAQQHGLKVILDVNGTPCWASSVPSSVDPVGCASGWWKYPVTNYPPTSPQYYANFSAYVAQRWGKYLAALELWNEPNGGQYFISDHPARDYAALVKAAYPAVKKVAPTLPVIMSLAGTDTQFLTWLYSWNVKGSYDGIAVHPYYQLSTSWAGLKAFHTEQLNNGDNTRLWATEVGWSSGQYGLQTQAAADAAALRDLATFRYVTAVEIYDMRDAGTDASNWNDSWGLVDYNLNPKPAWDAFKSELQSLASS